MATSKQERRKPTDHDTVMRIILILGLIAGCLCLCLGMGFVVSVYLAHSTGKEPIPGMAMSLATGLIGAFGSVVGYIASLLTNTQQQPRTPTGTPADPIVTETTGPNKTPVEVTEANGSEAQENGGEK